MKYVVNGDTTEKVGDYMQWSVEDDEGMMLCTFYGPMSRSAAITFCKVMNENNGMISWASDNIHGTFIYMKPGHVG